MGMMQTLAKLVPQRWRKDAALVPVVRLSGTIGAVTPLRPGMSLAGVAKILERAFAMRNARAVAVVINSPGGSPVQSRLIYQRIRQLAVEKKLPVLVFVEDVAASGGYMIACAGDEIFCDPSSILGSIGVVGGSFGFQELIRKIGGFIPQANTRRRWIRSCRKSPTTWRASRRSSAKSMPPSSRWSSKAGGRG